MKETSLPAFLVGEEILVPIKIDITHKGARFVDSFTWSITNTMLSPDEFASRTCMDLALPDAFKWKISLQIHEQINSYREIITILKSTVSDNKLFLAKLNELQQISVGIRHNIVDYSDKFHWDLNSLENGPELFAKTTCADLGLPSEMEPAIAHRIRETAYRTLLTWAEDPKILTTTPLLPSASDVKVMLVQPNQSVDMVTNLWRRARPGNIDEQAAVPQPRLPKEKDSNATIWKDCLI